ncbi:site-specific DNA-methyltransferase [Patescibacteria group bacterium]|nr:site-specific DNA-methyltransferase [Patescibacteria group bacterium]
MPKLSRVLLAKTKEKLAERVSELQTELKQFQSSVQAKEKYGLFWADKEEEFDEKAEDALPVIAPKADKKFPDVITDESSVDHVLIEGDNYHALSVLNYTHREKVDVIYIDPPYNTGNDGFKYRDKRSAKEFPDGVSVPRDHPFRHSYWLSFMAKRLKLAQELLKETGVIFISIDDNEVAQLKLLCDEIFGEENFVVCVSWRRKKEVSSDNRGIAVKAEYVLVYSKTGVFTPNKVPLREEYVKSSFKNSNNDPRGLWRGVAITASMGHQGGGYDYEVITPSGKKIKRKWLYPENSYKKLEESGLLYFGKTGDSVPQRIMFLKDSEGQTPDNLWLDVGTNKEGKNELVDVLGSAPFGTPKPTFLVKTIAKLAGDENAIILDFFAGSGTTAHAVAQLNKEDGGKRKCILVTNNENEICEKVCYERVKRVFSGYKNAKGENVAGLGGNLRYLKTDFVPKYADKANRKSKRVSDKAKLELTRRAGYMLALKESTFDEKEMTKSWQIFESVERITAVYFRENKKCLDELAEKLSKMKKPVKLYIFSWHRGEYRSAYPEYENICCEDIPEPILEVYKNIGL